MKNKIALICQICYDIFFISKWKLIPTKNFTFLIIISLILIGNLNSSCTFPIILLKVYYCFINPVFDFMNVWLKSWVIPQLMDKFRPNLHFFSIWNSYIKYQSHSNRFSVSILFYKLLNTPIIHFFKYVFYHFLWIWYFLIQSFVNLFQLFLQSLKCKLCLIPLDWF